MREILSDAIARLKAAGVDNPGLDARLLAAHVLRCDRARLLSEDGRVLTIEEAGAFQKLIERRVGREPVARILGLREFWGLPFALNEATLDPRPDSETLIEAALESFISLRGKAGMEGRSWGERCGVQDDGSYHAALPPPLTPPREGEGNLRVLDLGTGTGCLLLGLLHEWPEATGIGVDIAARAVEQARDNAKRLGLEERASFRVNDFLEGLTGTFDLIISNPPYVASGDMAGLMPEVRDHDPAAALDGGVDGLEVYRRLVPQILQFLNPGGVAIFEVGCGQAGDVCGLFRQAGFADITTRRDMGGIERCVVAKSPCPHRHDAQ